MAFFDKAGACVALAAVLLIAGGAHAATPVQKCQEKKLKAQGKLQLCLKKSSAKVLGGKPDESAACQMKFTDALANVDAKAMKKGASCHYIDNGDGTVSDLDTGLQWEQKDNLGGGANFSDPHDADNTYTWSMGTNDPDGTAFTHFLFRLNHDTSSDGTTISGCFAGHCDWRLPTSAELQTILDLTAPTCGDFVDPCIDPTFGPTTTFYWSATTNAGNPNGAWSVGFADGSVAPEDAKTNARFVRAVRGDL